MDLFERLIVHSAVIEGEDYGLNDVFKPIGDGWHKFEYIMDGIYLAMFQLGAFVILAAGLLTFIICFLAMFPFKSKEEKKSFWKTQGFVMSGFVIVAALLFGIPYAILA
ncbi:hypothetical protein [Terribacillus sp. 7520-G]|uniref:hypothetical protein n=1 Tax=Terribacillus TaxID=459532 RepID=UPI000BA6C712|nr:hypothetical protein [Terribacillus sp. 7520-G]PAD38203.1 hypothetical protein CHH53_11970 [Terribacillus sp. 7520-G]